MSVSLIPIPIPKELTNEQKVFLMHYVYDIIFEECHGFKDDYALTNLIYTRNIMYGNNDIDLSGLEELAVKILDSNSIYKDLYHNTTLNDIIFPILKDNIIYIQLMYTM